MKPVLMIHEVDEWMFNLPLHNYTLTFDDGLYTQYHHLDRIRSIETDKIFFISTGIIATENTEQSATFIKSHVAHRDFFKCGDLSHYMKWSQIQEIHHTPDCYIGGHSHGHIYKPTLKQIIHDTNRMIDMFNKHNIEITSFGFPYNDELPMYRSILHNKGVKKFYGEERIDIYDICDNEHTCKKMYQITC